MNGIRISDLPLKSLYSHILEGHAHAVIRSLFRRREIIFPPISSVLNHSFNKCYTYQGTTWLLVKVWDSRPTEW